MRIFKRAGIYLSNKIGKSVLILLVIVISMTLVLSSIAIQSAVTRAAEAAKKNIDAAVSVGLDFSKLTMDATVDDIDGLIGDKLLQEIDKSDYVLHTTVSLQNWVKTTQKPVKEDQDDNERGIMMHGSSSDTDIMMPTNKLISMKRAEDIKAFTSGSEELIAGVFPFESVAENPIIVSEAYAKLNDVSVGSTFDMHTNLEKKEEKTLFTVVGIFKINNFKKPAIPVETEDDRNKMYSTFDTGKAIMQNMGRTLEYENIDVILTSGEAIVPFIEQMRATDAGKSDFIKYSSDLDSYLRQTTAIQKVANSSQIIILVVGVAAIAILSLLLLLSLRDRNYEIGVLLAMGETRSALVLQIIFEMLIIACVAFAISFGTSTIVAGNLGEYLLASEISNNSANSSLPNFPQVNDGAVRNDGMEAPVIIGGGDDLTDSSAQQIDKLDITLINKDVLISSYALGFIIIILATFFPIIWMMRKTPKNIMLRKE